MRYAVAHALLVFVAVVALFWGVHTMLVASGCDGLVFWNPMAYCVVESTEPQPFGIYA